MKFQQAIRDARGDLNTYNTVWLLNRIKECIARSKKGMGWNSSRKYIYQGSYDVWDESLGPAEAVNMMNFYLDTTRAAGLIANESGKQEWEYNENWYVTPAGAAYLERHADPVN